MFIFILLNIIYFSSYPSSLSKLSHFFVLIFLPWSSCCPFIYFCQFLFSPYFCFLVFLFLPHKLLSSSPLLLLSISCLMPITSSNVMAILLFQSFSSLFCIALHILPFSFFQGAADGGIGNILELMRTVSEYGGAMNSTLHSVISMATSSSTNGSSCCLSYYMTSCFQHVYLATSTLWGEGALFGVASEDVLHENYRFK